MPVAWIWNVRKHHRERRRERMWVRGEAAFNHREMTQRIDFITEDSITIFELTLFNLLWECRLRVGLVYIMSLPIVVLNYTNNHNRIRQKQHPKCLHIKVPWCKAQPARITHWLIQFSLKRDSFASEMCRGGKQGWGTNSTDAHIVFLAGFLFKTQWIKQKRVRSFDERPAKQTFFSLLLLLNANLTPFFTVFFSTDLHPRIKK